MDFTEWNQQDQQEKAVTVTRCKPGNETAFLVPDQKCSIFSTANQSVTVQESDDDNIDFVVYVPVPQLLLSYIDEDSHICRDMKMRFDNEGCLILTEVLTDKSTSVSTRIKTTLKKESSEAKPFYTLCSAQSESLVIVGSTTLAVKPRKQNTCKRCGNFVKGHKGPVGKICDMEIKEI